MRISRSPRIPLAAINAKTHSKLMSGTRSTATDNSVNWKTADSHEWKTASSDLSKVETVETDAWKTASNDSLPDVHALIPEGHVADVSLEAELMDMRDNISGEIRQLSTRGLPEDNDLQIQLKLRDSKIAELEAALNTYRDQLAHPAPISLAQDVALQVTTKQLKDLQATVSEQQSKINELEASCSLVQSKLNTFYNEVTIKKTTAKLPEWSTVCIHIICAILTLAEYET